MEIISKAFNFKTYLYSNAKEIFDKIFKKIEMNHKLSKVKFIKRFFEYHSKLIFEPAYNSESEVKEEFIINVDDLKHI
jgi:hypothetical protein